VGLDVGRAGWKKTFSIQKRFDNLYVNDGLLMLINFSAVC